MFPATSDHSRRVPTVGNARTGCVVVGVAIGSPKSPMLLGGEEIPEPALGVT